MPPVPMPPVPMPPVPMPPADVVVPVVVPVDVVPFGMHLWSEQVSSAAQVPHTTDSPQPLGMVPHSSPGGQTLMGVQPQTLGVPLPPQVFGAEQAPQLIWPPQPSGRVP